MDMTVTGLLAAYRSGQLTPETVIDDCRARCTEHTDLNIWIRLLARAEIEPYLTRLRALSPDSLPLYGIPFAIKDNIDLAGIPTTAACPAFAYTPRDSAFVVQRLIAAGAIPIGKTNMDQFATGLVGTRSPAPWGPCHNPFNPEYIAGGSSSGSAVATALGLVSFALGTDTAGSGRVPAAFNNIIGVKPSRGLVSMTGVVPACRSLDCVSLFALTCDDANTILAQMIVFDAEDDYARANTYANTHHNYGRIGDRFTFGVPDDSQLEFFGNGSAQNLFHNAVHNLEALGGIRRTIDFAPFIEAARLLYEGPWLTERFIATQTVIEENPGAMLPVIASIIGAARNKTAVDAFKAEYQLQHYRQQTRRILEDLDFLVTPTTGTHYSIDQIERDPIRLNSQLGYYTNYMNLLDCAAVAVPAGFLANGLPWGITLVSTALQDCMLLSCANRWQHAMRYPLGAMQQPMPQYQDGAIRFGRTLPLVVCGAHLDGLALNWQLRERGATLETRTSTAMSYRLYALPGGPPLRPGLIRDETRGKAIEVEIWWVPSAEFGSFVAGIPAPLGIGRVQLADGRWLPGFICEAYALHDAVEITHLGGWRSYLKTLESDNAVFTTRRP